METLHVTDSISIKEKHPASLSGNDSSHTEGFFLIPTLHKNRPLDITDYIVTVATSKGKLEYKDPKRTIIPNIDVLKEVDIIDPKNGDILSYAQAELAPCRDASYTKARWTNKPAPEPPTGGHDGQIQFNSDGYFQGNRNLTWTPSEGLVGRVSDGSIIIGKELYAKSLTLKGDQCGNIKLCNLDIKPGETHIHTIPNPCVSLDSIILLTAMDTRELVFVSKTNIKPSVSFDVSITSHKHNRYPIEFVCISFFIVK